MRYLQAPHLAAIVFATVDELSRNDAVAEYFRFRVDIAKEEVKGGDALGKAALDVIPLLRRNEAGKQVVGKDFFGAFVASVDGEGDALVQKAEFGGVFAPL